ncbi:MAG: D-glycero-alpha-D-manno-heptose-1,7-bisphosphate 7-phosphatase [Chthoniobacterales bacterium]|jgi:D-glycero-D-manno-heptose 1,7-bisphosphate phosphatase
MTAERPAVFLDRDGTLIREVDFCRSPSQVCAVPGAAEALLRLQAAGFVLIIVTNQSGIGRGYFTHEDFRQVQDETLWQLKPAIITATYFDDSTPDQPSDRRKPSPKMIEEAARDHGLDLSASWMVGDRAGDIACGRRAGVRTILVETGYGKDHRECGADAVVPEISDAADRILQEVSCPR